MIAFIRIPNCNWCYGIDYLEFYFLEDLLEIVVYYDILAHGQMVNQHVYLERLNIVTEVLSKEKTRI